MLKGIIKDIKVKLGYGKHVNFILITDILDQEQQNIKVLVELEEVFHLIHRFQFAQDYGTTDDTIEELRNKPVIYEDGKLKPDVITWGQQWRQGVRKRDVGKDVERVLREAEYFKANELISIFRKNFTLSGLTEEMGVFRWNALQKLNASLSLGHACKIILIGDEQTALEVEQLINLIFPNNKIELQNDCVNTELYLKGEKDTPEHILYCKWGNGM